MKNSTLLSLFCLVTGSVAATTYEELLQNFKEQLYSRQTGLMSNKEQYFAFITPLLKHTETQLRVPKYLKENPNCSLAQHYFSCMLDYNVCCFQFYIRDVPVGRTFDSYYFGQLHSVIIDILRATITGSDDVIYALAEQETKKTAEYLYNANKAYYAQLPWHIKSAITVNLFMHSSESQNLRGGPAVNITIKPRR